METFIKLLCSVPLIWICHELFLHFFFLVLTIINKAVMDIQVCVPGICCACAQDFLRGIYLEVES